MTQVDLAKATEEELLEELTKRVLSKTHPLGASLSDVMHLKNVYWRLGLAKNEQRRALATFIISTAQMASDLLYCVHTLDTAGLYQEPSDAERAAHEMEKRIRDHFMHYLGFSLPLYNREQRPATSGLGTNQPPSENPENAHSPDSALSTTFPPGPGTPG